MTPSILFSPFEMGGHRELRVVALGEKGIVATASVRGVGQTAVTIYQLYVVPGGRGRGVGTQMVKAIEQEVAALGAKWVNAIVEPGGPGGFWGALGYEVVHQEGATRVVARRMEERCSCQSISEFARMMEEGPQALLKEY